MFLISRIKRKSRTNSGHKIPIKSAGGSVVQGDGRLHLRYCYYFIGWEDQGFSCLSLLRNLKYRAMSTSSHPLCIDNHSSVYLACRKICPKWEDLAARLFVCRPSVEAIRADGKDSADCLRMLLDEWLKRSSSEQPLPSWKGLCNALSHLDLPLAESISAQHQCGCSFCTGHDGEAPIGLVSPLYNEIYQKLKNPVGVAEYMYSKNAFSLEPLEKIQESPGNEKEVLLTSLESAVSLNQYNLRVFGKALMKEETTHSLGKSILANCRKEEFPSQRKIKKIVVQRKYKREFQNMRTALGQLCASTVTLLSKKKVSVSDLKNKLKFSFPEMASDLEKCSSLNEVVKNAIRPRVSLVQIDYLEAVFDLFKLPKRAIQEYNRKADELYKRISVACEQSLMDEFDSSNTSELESIEFVLEWDENECLLKDIHDLFPKIVRNYSSQVKVIIPPEGNSIASDYLREDGNDTILKKAISKPEEQNSTDDQQMAELVESQIRIQGKLDLRILKGLLLGGPGVGKTTTILRLLGKLLNLSESGPSASTGITTPEVVHLCHPLYRDAAEISLIIEKEWKSLSLDDQLGAILYCLPSHPVVEEVEKVPQALSLPKEDATPVSKWSIESFSPSGQLVAPSRGLSSKGPLEKLEKSPYVTKFRQIEDFIKKSKWREAHQMLEGIMQTTILHITDTGGQPEFFEILPLLLRGPSLSLIFLNLVQPLTERFDVVYRHSKSSKSLVEYVSSYTPIDMVHQVLASLESLNHSDQRSAAFLIGTHHDLANEELVREFEQKIETSLKQTSFYENDLLRKFRDQRQKWRLLFTVDNQNGDLKDINFLREVLTNTIHDLFHPESLPTSWVFFHLLLRHTYERNGLCSLTEAVELAGCCGVEDESTVRDVLHYFYLRFGTVFYFGDVVDLKDVVICDPNLIFHPITRLIAESFGANPRDPNTAEKIRKTGEISLKFFEKICQMDEKTRKIDTKKIVALLKHLHVITEIHNGGVRLFMSCLLRCYPTAKLGIGKGQLSAMNPAPLIFTFSTGYQPIGLFHVLLSRLLCKNFFLHEERFRNRVVLFYRSVKVEILSTPSNLEIRKNKGMMCKEVLDLLHGEITTIMKEMPHMRNIDCYISFPCPLSLQHSSESVHLAELKMTSSESFLCCSECVEPMELEGRHEIWFKNDQAEKVSQSLLGVNNSEKNADSTLTVEEILQQNFSDLLEAVPNPVKLANDLWTAQLISLTLKNDVLSNRAMSDYEKASKMLNEATKLLKAFKRNPDRQMKNFKALCQVLQRQDDPVLSSLVDSMLKASGQ